MSVHFCSGFVEVAFSKMFIGSTASTINILCKISPKDVKMICHLTCTLSEAQARVAGSEAELKEKAGQVESLQNQLKQAQMERDQLMEASKNTECGSDLEVKLHFLLCF